MKRFYNNTLISRVSKRTLQVVALLCVLLGVSGSAWGVTGFHVEEGKALSLLINDSWYDFGIDGHTGVNHLGNYLPGECPKLNEFYYRTYKKDDDVCQKGYILINLNGEKAWGSTNSVAEIGRNDDGYIYQRWSGETFNNILSTTIPGTYSFDLYVKARVGNCEANEEFWIWLNNGNQNYKFSYTIVTPIYVYGYGATEAGDKFAMCEVTSDANIVRYPLKHIGSSGAWFEFSDKESANKDNFYKKANINSEKCVGAKLNGDQTNGNSLWAQITDEHVAAGYSEPVYFYYNTSDNTYWVEATKKTTYSIVFEDGTTYACEGTEEGTPCVQNIELGKGTYQFKVYKNETAYSYGSTIEERLDKTALTAIDAYSTITVDSYSACTFTINDESSTVYLTVETEEIPEPLLLSYNPVISTDGKTATLSAYLQGTLCTESDNITDYGFVICAGGNSGCIPDAQSTQVKPASTPALGRGDSYTYDVTTSNNLFIGGVTYGYRGYVVINGVTYLTRETGYFRLDDDCVPQTCCGETAVTFTIDASLGEDYENDCKLIYGSLQTAIYKLKDSHLNEDETQHFVSFQMTADNKHENYLLNQPVIFDVKYYDDTPDDPTKAYCYEGDTKAGVSGGGSDSENSMSLIFKDFNREDATVDGRELGDYTFTVKGGSGTSRPWLHHVILRNSRNMVLDNLAIFSDPSNEKQDDALEFDLNNGAFWDINVGDRDHNILVKNCMIGSNGFTGLHASGYDGITFENNEFEAIMATTGDVTNAVDWGASAKFMMCKNIKFVRNNFRGAHATLVWLQECQNVLFMNNVFWNTNQYDGYSGCSAIRVVAQYNRNITHHGFYFNTFYLADNTNGSNGEKYNFLKFELTVRNGGGSANNYIEDNIAFMFNNCYSYDTDVPGKNTDPFIGIDLSDKFPNICKNNFWSVYDQNNPPEDGVTSAFAFGCDANFTNVSNLVCATTASGPASLVIKGGGDLNKVITSDTYSVENFASAISDYVGSIEVTTTDIQYDRYNAGIRPTLDEDDDQYKWTYGAYQGKDGVEVSEIYWVGVNSNWDDRNNWVYFTNNTEQLNENQSRGTVMQRLSCINNLSNDLKVIIPEHPLVQLEQGRQWPVIPASFDAKARAEATKTTALPDGIPAAEQVTTMDDTQFAYHIELEYGAAIKGVESLVNGDVHYTKATTYFEAPRSQWVLVGTVVQPFTNGVGSDPRNILSGDYFLNHEPQVYMHEATITDGAAIWDKTFADLYKEVTPTQVFAINIPDEYGKACMPSAFYYNEKYFPDRADATKLNHGSVPIPYTFEGRFVNEAAMTTYIGLTKDTPIMMSNSYPCNMSAKMVQTKGGIVGNVSYYDYTACSFRPLGDDDVMLKPQHGFVFEPTASGDFTFTTDMLADGNTRSRSIEQPMPSFSIGLYNANTNTNMSEIIVRYDALHQDGVAHSMDAQKIFAPNAATPELYMVMYDAEYARLHTAKASQTIPLGIELKQAMNVKFSLLNNNQYSQVILVDTQTGKEYDLLQRSYTTELLQKGTIEGRFYLNLEVEGEYDSDQDADDDFTTDIEDTASEEASIQILTDNTASHTLRVIGNNVELQTIYVSDMSGRTMRYDANGHAATLQLPVSQGVYLVQVIGDKATRIEKVIVK